MSEMQVPLIWSAVGIWNAIFSPPAPGGPMNVIVKASSVWKRVLLWLHAGSFSLSVVTHV